MKNRLPRTRELAFFAAMALVCTLVVKIIGKHEVGFAVMGRGLLRRGDDGPPP